MHFSMNYWVYSLNYLVLVIYSTSISVHKTDAKAFVRNELLTITCPTLLAMPNFPTF